MLKCNMVLKGIIYLRPILLQMLFLFSVVLDSCANALYFTFVRKLECEFFMLFLDEMISDCLIIFVFFFYISLCEFIIKANFVWNKAVSLLFYICNVILRKPVLALTPEYRKAANYGKYQFYSLWFDLTGAWLDDLPHSRWTC